MSDNNKVVEDKKEKPKTEQELAKLFVDEYQSLCDKYGFRINVNPAFTARDDGTWSLVLQTSVGKTPKELTK